jgi:hypothetical protein
MRQIDIAIVIDIAILLKEAYYVQHNFQTKWPASLCHT